jgi:toxin ParE1/3/4
VKPHAFHPAAAAEYVAAAGYYAGFDPDLAGRFHDEVETVIRRIRRQPRRFRRVFGSVRRALCVRFPYAVLYVDQPGQIWIVAVMHGWRRPGYWSSRMS